MPCRATLFVGGSPDCRRRDFIGVSPATGQHRMLRAGRFKLPAGSQGSGPPWENFSMSVVSDKVPENFVAGLEGVVAFTTEIAEPDKDCGALRSRGVEIENVVVQR